LVSYSQRPLYPRRKSHWLGAWVDPRPVWTTWRRKKFLTLPGLELRPLGRPAYRLLYPGSLTVDRIMGGGGTTEFVVTLYHLSVDFKSACDTINIKQLCLAMGKLKIRNKPIRMVKLTVELPESHVRLTGC
jgi:hypothetical protein